MRGGVSLVDITLTADRTSGLHSLANLRMTLSLRQVKSRGTRKISFRCSDMNLWATWRPWCQGSLPRYLPSTLTSILHGFRPARATRYASLGLT